VETLVEGQVEPSVETVVEILEEEQAEILAAVVETLEEEQAEILAAVVVAASRGHAANNLSIKRARVLRTSFRVFLFYLIAW
jgi:hypothetical protein